MPRNLKTRLWRWLPRAMLVGVVVAGGCAHGPVMPRRAPIAHAGNQGGSWELVMPGRGVAQRLAGADPTGLPEYARRDAALSLRTPDPVTAIDAWPPRERARLDRARRLFIRSRPGEFIYFRGGEPHHHHWWPEGY